ncbi:MAG: phosphoribosylformimino-5-aminoimidazole carboxamide ribotide isomerase [Lachnospiraceae bacterium]
MRLRPCIDIHDGKVKQIVGSSLRDDKDAPSQNFVSPKGAAYFAEIYRRRNLPGGHIILLNPAGTPAYEADAAEARRALAAYPGGMQVGGGIRPDNARAWLDAGASHVIVTSYVFREGRLDRERLGELLAVTGREHLVLDLSCRREPSGAYVVVTDRWQKKTSLVVNEETLEELSQDADEFLIHAADVEGKRGGVEEDLVRILGTFAEKTGFPVTYAGGVHALEDLALLRKASGGALDVTVGSALDLFGGDLTLEELEQACR